MSQAQAYGDLLWGVERSKLYHTVRRDYLLRLHTAMTFCTLAAAVGVGASANAGAAATAVAVVGAEASKWPLVPIFCSLVIVLLTLIDKALAPRVLAEVHARLMKQFTALEIAMRMVPAEVATAEQIAQWTRQRLELETDEPPVRRVLDLRCHNQLLRAQMGGAASLGKEFYPMLCWTALTCHWSELGLEYAFNQNSKRAGSADPPALPPPAGAGAG